MIVIQFRTCTGVCRRSLGKTLQILRSLQKPWMLRGGMVQHQIRDNADPTRMTVLDQRLKIFQSSIGRIDRHVICHIVFVVCRRRTYRHEPDLVKAQILDVVQFISHTAQIADSVCVRVTERINKDLICCAAPLVFQWDGAAEGCFAQAK